MMKQCKSCNKNLNKGFFNEQSGDECVFCASEKITLNIKTRVVDYEEVEDKGCAGGACTL